MIIIIAIVVTIWSLSLSSCFTVNCIFKSGNHYSFESNTGYYGTLYKMDFVGMVVCGHSMCNMSLLNHLQRADILVWKSHCKDLWEHIAGKYPCAFPYFIIEWGCLIGDNGISFCALPTAEFPVILWENYIMQIIQKIPIQCICTWIVTNKIGEAGKTWMRAAQITKTLDC